MKVLGLTGGVGMGKSTVAGMFTARGATVVDTDELARQVVDPGEPALEEIRREFGPQVISSSGQLRRDELARIVFSDTVARQKLEGILHPRIRTLWMQQVQQCRALGKSPVVVVIPLLFETGAEEHFDATICVACSSATQSNRLAARGWTPAESEQRVAAQWPIEKKIAKADVVIWTEGSLDVVSEQVDRVFALEVL